MFWPYQLPMILEYFAYFALVLINLLYYMRNFADGTNAANNLINKNGCLKSPQYYA